MRRGPAPFLTFLLALAGTVVGGGAAAADGPDPWAPDRSGTDAVLAECLGRESVVPVGGGYQTGSYGRKIDLAPETTIDARDAAWQMRPTELIWNAPWDWDYANPPLAAEGWIPHEWKSTHWRYPVALKDGNATDVCMVGPTVFSAVPDQRMPEDPLVPFDQSTWDPYGWDQLWHHTSGVAFVAGGNITSPTLVGGRISGVGDGVSISGANAGFADDPWRVQGVHVADIGDDCIEADSKRWGVVDDTLLDGCWSAISASGGGATPTGATVTVSNSLIRLAPKEAPYRPAKYGPQPFEPYHGSPFKWQDGPALVLDNVVIATGDSGLGSGVGFSLPPDTTCTGSTLVWTGPTPRPHLGADVEDCFDVITDDAGLWEDARDAWLAAHPDAISPPGTPGTPTVSADGRDVSWTAASGAESYTVRFYDPRGVLVGSSVVGQQTSLSLGNLDVGPAAGGAFGRIEVVAANADGLGPPAAATGLWLTPHAPAGGATALDRFIDELDASFPGPMTPDEEAWSRAFITTGYTTPPTVVLLRRDDPDGHAVSVWEPMIRMYMAATGAAPTTTELLNMIGSEWTVEDIAALIEALSGLQFPSSLSDAELVAEVYETLLGEPAPTGQELADEVAEVQAIGRGRYVSAVSDRSEYRERVWSEVEAHVLSFGLLGEILPPAELDPLIALLEGPRCGACPLDVDGEYGSAREPVVRRLLAHPTYVARVG